MMIVTPNPTRPPPVIVPRSDLVNPNWAAQSRRMAPRTANPMPAAISVRKLARKMRRWLDALSGPESYTPAEPLIESVMWSPRSAFGLDDQERLVLSKWTGGATAGNVVGGHHPRFRGEIQIDHHIARGRRLPAVRVTFPLATPAPPLVDRPPRPAYNRP